MTTRAEVPIDRANAAASVDLPIPASPSTVSQNGVAVRTVVRKAVRSEVSSRCLPRIGASGGPTGVADTSPRSRHALTG